MNERVGGFRQMTKLTTTIDSRERLEWLKHLLVERDASVEIYNDEIQADENVTDEFR